MAEPEQEPPEKKLSLWRQFLEDASWDIPGARAFGNLLLGIFIQEGKAVKRGLFAFLVFTILAFWGGCHYSEQRIDDKFAGITNYFSGELNKRDFHISELNDSISNFKGQLTDAKQDRDKYQMMLAPFEAMAIAKYTNAPLDQRLDLMLDAMTAVTNAFATDKPILHLEINGTKINGIESPKVGDVMPVTPVLLNANREIALFVINDSTITAEHISVDFMAAIDGTNILAAQWFLEPKQGAKNHWHLVAEDTYGAMQGWTPQTVVISQNFRERLLTVQFLIHADRSKTWEYCVIFVAQ